MSAGHLHEVSEVGRGRAQAHIPQALEYAPHGGSSLILMTEYFFFGNEC